jgi:hypothetical protein
MALMLTDIENPKLPLVISIGYIEHSPISRFSGSMPLLLSDFTKDTLR